MYRGFSLNLDWTHDDDFFEKGQILYKDYNKKVRKTINDFLSVDGSLNGTKMQSNWFPQIEADVFISHSHKDEKRAIAFAGWLYTKHGIKSFIDSSIWGYADDLLKIIDNKFCLNKNETTYNYTKRNYSTSHVHIMLSTALSMMIDKTECLFFLNTPNSISTSDIVKKTESPWIYSELAITQIVKKDIPERRQLEESRYFSKAIGIDEQLKIKYEVGLNHLKKINFSVINKWNMRKFLNAYEALDYLYDLSPIYKSNL